MKVKHNGHELNVIVSKKPFAEYVEFYEMDGEWYASLETYFPDNPLLGAIWIETGGTKEELAALIPNILKKTDRFYDVKIGRFTTKYQMYELV